MMEVKPAEPYPDDYDAIVAQVDEENEPGYTPSQKQSAFRDLYSGCSLISWTRMLDVASCGL